MITVENTKANRAVADAVASFAIEDLYFDEEFIRKMLDYANGKMTDDEITEYIQKRHGIDPRAVQGDEKEV